MKLNDPFCGARCGARYGVKCGARYGLGYALIFALGIFFISHIHAKSEWAEMSFSEIENQFLEEFWQLNPSWATYVGNYVHDNLLLPNDETLRQSKLEFIDRWTARLQSLQLESALERIDRDLILGQLESERWYLQEFKRYQWAPSQYNVADTLALILNTDYKPLNERLDAISQQLKAVPAYYAAAKANIKTPTRVDTELAIQQSKGALEVFEQMIPAAIETSSLPNEQKQLLSQRCEQAKNTVQAYIKWLQDMLVERQQWRDFRIGEALYEQKFKHYIGAASTAKQLFENALVAKDGLHKHMIQLTETLWPKYMSGQELPENRLQAVATLIDHLSAKHVGRDEFVDEIKRQIPLIEAFVNEHDLLDQDPTRPLVVRATPKYQRGVSIASVDSPGPYDPTANTYYNVTPLDHYSEAQAESYLREYNHWILQILNIHEAIPGHYTQLMFANKSPSKIKSIFYNGAMIEGWAVYVERMMLENGFAGPTAEMWLMYNKWNLRVVVNTILDYSVHVLGMEREQALELLMQEAFQQQTEAEGKWRRVSVTQVQLTSYYSGYTEIYALREALKAAHKEKFDLKQFHHDFLSYGNAPVTLIRQQMQAK